MRLHSAAAFWALTASAFPHATQAKDGLRRKLAKKDCTIMAVEALGLEGNEDPELIVECELHPDDADGISGIALEIEGDSKQMAALRKGIKEGKIHPAQDNLDLAGAEITDKTIKLPPGLEVAANVRQNEEKKVGRRRLVSTLGDVKMLLVRVTDVNGLVYGDGPAVMSDEVFGTGVDPVNLKSSLEECSWDKMTVSPGIGDPNEVATGVIEVDIGVPLEGNSRSTIRNAVTTAVQNKLGHSLPGPYDYILYSLQGCYVDCGWAAYAYINSWNSVYQGYYYKRPGVLVHELGHNFGLAHSGGTDGATYTDHTCSMGNPHYTDDDFQCFNPAKNFQLNWYNDAKITVDPRTAGYGESLTLVGIGEYPYRGASPVTVRLETGAGNDYFVGFNRATGPNRLNDEADDLVTVVQVNGNNGQSYSQSFLKAKLSQGQSYSITNFGGTTNTVTITAESINIATTPGTAVVCISNGSSTCGSSAPTPNPTPPPTQAPVPPTPPPTPFPTPNPTPPPTQAPVPPTPPPTPFPTPNPTPPPTQAPVPPTPPPTPFPTPNPTPPPTSAPVVTVRKYVCAKKDPLPATICADGVVAGGECTSVDTNSGCGNGGKSCWWASCPDTGGGPGPSPTPPPTPPTGPTGGCPYCSATGDVCCAPNTCIEKGNPANRGCK